MHFNLLAGHSPVQVSTRKTNHIFDHQSSVLQHSPPFQWSNLPRRLQQIKETHQIVTESVCESMNKVSSCAFTFTDLLEGSICMNVRKYQTTIKRFLGFLLSITTHQQG